ncbi:MAG: helix-turn-helix transcriptional regulator [Actinobacteria bacterium]|nr:helix-turn-helix transcriptional regulator [Actinomycetota bacterium]
MDFATRFKEARIAAGLTQAELAAGLVTPGFVSHIELGRREPTAEVLESLCARMKVQVEEIRPFESNEMQELQKLQIWNLITVGDLGNADLLVDQSLKSAPAHSTAQNEFKCLKGILEHKNQNFDAAINLLDISIKYCKDIKIKGEAVIALLKSIAFTGDLKLALLRAEKYLELSEYETWDVANRITLLCQTSTIHSYLGNFKAASRLANSALDFAESIDDPLAKSQMHWTAASVADDIGDKQKAIQQMHLAIKYSEFAGAEIAKVKQWGSLAAIIVESNEVEPESVLKTLDKAIGLAEASADKHTLALALHAKVHFYFKHNNVKAARDNLTKCRELLSPEHDWLNQALEIQEIRCDYLENRDIEAMMMNSAKASINTPSDAQFIRSHFKFIADEAKSQGRNDIAVAAYEKVLSFDSVSINL